MCSTLWSRYVVRPTIRQIKGPASRCILRRRVASTDRPLSLLRLAMRYATVLRYGRGRAPGRPQRQFQAWGLDPRKRRGAQGRASTNSGDQGAAPSDAARNKVGRKDGAVPPANIRFSCPGGSENGAPIRNYETNGEGAAGAQARGSLTKCQVRGGGEGGKGEALRGAF